MHKDGIEYGLSQWSQNVEISSASNDAHSYIIIYIYFFELSYFIQLKTMGTNYTKKCPYFHILAHSDDMAVWNGGSR